MGKEYDEYLKGHVVAATDAALWMCGHLSAAFDDLTVACEYVESVLDELGERLEEGTDEQDR